jgi:hypothetical protein
VVSSGMDHQFDVVAGFAGAGLEALGLVQEDQGVGIAMEDQCGPQGGKAVGGTAGWVLP